jgi:hypothetical protein
MQADTHAAACPATLLTDERTSAGMSVTTAINYVDPIGIGDASVMYIAMPR